MAVHIGIWIPAHDPDDTTKCTIDVAPYLPSGVTVSSASAVNTPAGITVASTTSDTTTVTHTLTGGTRGEDYTMTTRVVLSDSQQKDWEWTLPVR